MKNNQTKIVSVEQESSEIADVQQNSPEIVNSADPMLAMIHRVCSDPNFPIDKMEKLIDMRNAELKRVAEIDFNRSFAEMQSQLPKVSTKHKNQQTNSKYAKIEDINEAVLPVLNQYGFGISFKILSQEKDGVTVRAVLAHSGGHKESTDLYMPYDKSGAQGKINKTDIHATGSTITYAKRYAMCMLLDISTGDDNDGNNALSQFITTQQVQEINNLLDITNADKIKFTRDYMKVPAITRILAKDYRKAINALQGKLQKGNNNANS